MSRPLRSRTSGVVWCLVASTACGGGDGSTATGPTRAVAVEFVYRAPTRVDLAVAERYPACVAGVGRTHIHPSWLDFQLVHLAEAGPDRWQIAFSSVPVGRRYSVRISDPNACATDPNGASTNNVYANGVLLTQIVSTPGNGQEPGLAFTVSADGQILP